MTTRRKTLEQFIIDVIKIHGYKYDYSLVKYINNKTKVKIICKEHGEFEQTPKMHLKGQDCYDCGIIKRSKSKTKTEEKFIEEAKEVHNNKYDYSNINYITTHIKIKIICPIHGEFLQTPSSHLNGCGCPKCVGKNKTTEEYIKSVMIVHNNKYDYPLVDYKGNKIKIKIICPIHGIFEQRPIEHLRGHGCKKCADLEKSYNLRYTKDEYKEVANKVHNNKYDYSLMDYTDCYSKIKIICPIHGEFEQVACSHLSGCGCQMCSESKGEYIIRNFLEKNNIKFKTEKIFNKCKDKRCLPFDFYLNENNTCIEYDGIQHFESIDFFGGVDSLNSLRIRDEIKNNFCKEYNINLLRIKYDENIEEKLNNYLIGLI